jgi:hypothetical protein
LADEPGLYFPRSLLGQVNCARIAETPAKYLQVTAVEAAASADGVL